MHNVSVDSATFIKRSGLEVLLIQTVQCFISYLQPCIYIYTHRVSHRMPYRVLEICRRDAPGGGWWVWD